MDMDDAERRAQARAAAAAAGTPPAEVASGADQPRERVEVALELRGLAAVIFATARESTVGRSGLLRASEALAEAPLCVHDTSGRALLALVRTARVSLVSAVRALAMTDAPQVQRLDRVVLRLARVEVELSP